MQKTIAKYCENHCEKTLGNASAKPNQKLPQNA